MTNPAETKLRSHKLQDTRALREAYGSFSTGVAVVTTRDGDTDLGMTCSSFNVVSLAPPLVLWNLQANALSLPAYEASGSYTVSILAADQERLAMQFAMGDQASRFANVNLQRAESGNAIVGGAVAWFDCQIQQIIPAGDHHILLAAVTDYAITESYETNQGLIYERSQFGKRS